MKFTKISDICKYEGKDVLLRGWVYRKRELGGLFFLIIRDSSGIVQCVINKNCNGYKNIKSLQIEGSVVVFGTVKRELKAPGTYEIEAKALKIVHPGEAFPITKDFSTDFLLDVRHLWIRSRKLTAIMKVKHTVLNKSREWFLKDGWYEVTPPIITSNACEGGSTLFNINYFGRKVYLSQSAQLYLEALIFSLEKVFSVTPSFRAEKSRTRRHLTEYTHVEGEAAWYGFKENLKVQEELISYVVNAVIEKNNKELKILNRDIRILKNIEPPFEKIRYNEALDMLRKEGIEIEWGKDFGANEERVLATKFEKPFFVTHFPREAKAFYMKVDEKDNKLVKCADMLAPEGYGEIIGGSERETNVKKLIKRLRAEGANLKNYEWYLDLRKYGSVQHSGFGLGVERLVMWICKLDHIRDATPFPRTITRVYP